jgi:hypothetical protein
MIKGHQAAATKDARSIWSKAKHREAGRPSSGGAEEAGVVMITTEDKEIIQDFHGA